MVDLELVVFDVAGTTVRDDGQVPTAFTAAFREHGLPTDPHVLRSLRGASKRQAVHDLLPSEPERADAVYAAFRQHLTRAFAAGVSAVPGAVEVFAWLHDRGVKVALNTGFDRDTLTPLLAALGWDDGRLDAVACGDEVDRGRPAPDLIRRCMRLTGVDDPRTVATVGDTVLDLRAGTAAGVGFNVGVLSGAHGRDLLVAEPYTHLIGSVAELPAVFAT